MRRLLAFSLLSIGTVSAASILAAPAADAAAKSTHGADYAAYIHEGAGTAQAQFVLPAFSCAGISQAAGAPMIIVTVLRGKVETSDVAGVSMDCKSGVPTTEVNALVGGGADSFPEGRAHANEVKSGDHVLVTVSVSAAKSTATVHDLTTHKVVQAVGPGGKAYYAGAYLATAGPGNTILPTPAFKPIGFESIVMDGKPLGSYHPSSVNLVYGDKSEATVGPIHGGDSFTITYHHP